MVWAGQVTLAPPLATSEAAVDQLEALVREHARFVFKVAYSVLRQREDAEDAVQETFLRVLRRGWEDIREPRLWLARIAWRIAVDRIRKRREESVEDLGAGGLQLRAGGPGAEQVVINDQMLGVLQRLIARLPRDLREVIALSTVQELSSAEMAEVLGIPEGTVRNRLFRARQMLREKMLAITEAKHDA